MSLLMPREVDELLRYPRGRALKLAKSGALPAIFLPNGEVRFDADAIRRWIDDHRQPAEVPNGAR